jgi:hypothetical protein
VFRDSLILETCITLFSTTEPSSSNAPRFKS